MFHGPRLPFLTWTLEHADAPSRSRTRLQLLPLLHLLLAPVGGHLAMQAEHGESRVFDHGVRDARFDHAHHRQFGRQ